MATYEEMTNELKRLRDEAKLQIHLGTADAKKQWEELEAEWKVYQRDAEAKLKQSGDEADAKWPEFSSNMKDGYNKVLESLKA